jgi:hypothetical protein
LFKDFTAFRSSGMTIKQTALKTQGYELEGRDNINRGYRGFNFTETMSASFWVFRAQSDWTLIHTSHEDIEQSTIEASITLDVVKLTHWSDDRRMNDLQFAARYQCLPIRRSGRVITLHNEHYRLRYVASVFERRFQYREYVRVAWGRLMNNDEL